MRRFVAGTVATVAVYGAFYLHSSPVPPDQEWQDDAWITVVVGTFTVATLVMLLPRIPWTWRGVGVFLTTVSFAALYGLILRQRHGEPLSPGDAEAWADVVRAGGVVGGPLLLYGLLDWLGDWFADTRLGRWLARSRFGRWVANRRLGDWWRDRRAARSPDGLDRTGTGSSATVHPRRRADDWDGGPA